jgi:hypothetical protein
LASTGFGEGFKTSASSIFLGVNFGATDFGYSGTFFVSSTFFTELFGEEIGFI